ncbi:MAG: molybdopterin-dependent oxidoreductase [Desulfarculaceae bacterium]
MAKEKMNPSRRRFLKWSALAAGGLALGVYGVSGGEKVKKASEVWEAGPGDMAPNAWVRIGLDGRVTVRVNHTEMGQGVSTSLPMIVAEELDADWSKVDFEIAPAESIYKNPQFNTQMTAASTSLHTSWDILRRAGAAAREMLIAAAADRFKAPSSQCRTQKGQVIHQPSSRSLSYGELARDAAQKPVPENPRLKSPDRFELIGRPLPRLDTPAKVKGRAVFGLDVRMPGLLTAMVVHPPILGGRLAFLDPGPALAVPGVRRVLPMEKGVAVVAEAFWPAQKGADALKITWDNDQALDLDSDALMKRWAALARQPGDTVFETGELDAAMASAHRIVEASYESPFQAHATPEPMNATAWVRPDRCEVWAPTQHQDAAQEIAARICGLPYSKVSIHTTFTGGGFGRRICVDYVAEAVQVSKAMAAPVKIVWTREEDMRGDYYRPANYHLLRAGLDQSGQIIGWLHRLVGPDHFGHQMQGLIPSMMPYAVPRLFRNAGTSLARLLVPYVVPGKKIMLGAAPLDYKIENMRAEHINDDPGVPIGFWRSVAHSHNAFVKECFLDRVARTVGRDPLEYRLGLLPKNSLLRPTLECAAQKAGWGRPSGSDLFQGLAAHNFHETMLACVAEVSPDKSQGLKINRIVCAVDCGLPVNPRTVEDMVIGAIIFGLTATVKSSISIRKGRVQQGNFDDFPLIGMDEAPPIQVHIMKSSRPPHGLGEAAVPIIAPALANAVTAATQKSIQRLPLKL